MSSGDERAGIKHVAPLRQRNIVTLEYDSRILADRHTLPGQGGFVRMKLHRGEQTSVRRKFVTGLHAQNVTDDDFTLRHKLKLAAANHLHLRIFIDFIQGLKCLRAPAFHHDRDHHGKKDRRKNPQAFQKIRLAAGTGAGNIDTRCNHCGQNQHDQHRFTGCIPDPLQQRIRLLSGKRIASVKTPALRDLLRGQPVRSVRSQPPQGFLRRLHKHLFHPAS